MVLVKHLLTFSVTISRYCKASNPYYIDKHPLRIQSRLLEEGSSKAFLTVKDTETDHSGDRDLEDIWNCHTKADDHLSLRLQLPGTPSDKHARTHVGSPKRRRRNFEIESKRREALRASIIEQCAQKGLNSSMPAEQLADLLEFIDPGTGSSTSLTRIFRGLIASQVNREYLQAFNQRRKMIRNDKYAMQQKMGRYRSDPESIQEMHRIVQSLIDNKKLVLDDIPIQLLEYQTRGLKSAPLFDEWQCFNAIQMYLAFEASPAHGAYFNRLRRDYQRLSSI